MKNNKRAIIAFVGILAGLEHWAWGGECDFTLSVNPINVSWDLNYTYETVQVTVTKNKSKACDYGITFSRGGATDYNRRAVSGVNTIRYQLYKTATLTDVLKETPDITSANEYFSGSLGVGVGLTASHTYYFQIPNADATTPSIKPSGTYTDSFNVKVYKSKVHSDFTGSPDDNKNVAVSISVPKILDISMVDSGAGFDAGAVFKSLDFGTISANQYLGFDFIVRTNAGYQVTFSSTNSGNMKHVSIPSSTIPYTVEAHSSSFSLASPTVILTGSGQTNPSGQRNDIKIRIGNFGDVDSGQYSDYITVTAATTE